MLFYFSCLAQQFFIVSYRESLLLEHQNLLTQSLAGFCYFFLFESKGEREREQKQGSKEIEKFVNAIK